MDPKEKTAEQLAQENEELKAKLAQLESARSTGALDPDAEKDVRARQAAGLTREQALECYRAQQAWDKQLADEAAKAKAAKK